MALSAYLDQRTAVLSIAFALLGLIASLYFYFFYKAPFPKNAPRQTPISWPILGSMQFFTERWDFYKRSLRHSANSNFSFYAGQYPVIALTGEDARKLFFENKALQPGPAYEALLGGTPRVKENNNPLVAEHGGSEFSAYFNKRLIAMVKGNRLKEGLPFLLKDARSMLDDLSKEPSGITNPFDSIYKMVFKFTMRTVACNEIAEDPVLLAKVLKHFEDVESTATPLSIAYPWIPTPAKLRRVYIGSQLYIIFKGVVDARKKEGRKEKDALQFCLDQGDSITDVLMFVLGALFAGQLNSGINSAWILVYLTNKPYWMERVRDEVSSVADRYCPTEGVSLKDRLMQVPIEAWEGEFPIVDMCLKDSIRLQMTGAAFRKNMSGADIPLNKAGTEVIPSGAYVTYAAGDAHLNPDIYPNPEEWDPSRYMPDRAEDKKHAYGWFGWGLGRHPCLGMRFAKLEVNMIVAFFLAYFDEITLCDAKGAATSTLPRIDFNHHTAHKPEGHIYLKYKAKA